MLEGSGRRKRTPRCAALNPAESKANELRRRAVRECIQGHRLQCRDQAKIFDALADTAPTVVWIKP